MSRSLAKSGKATATKLLKEKCERSVQSTRENGENEVGASSTITTISLRVISGGEVNITFEETSEPFGKGRSKLRTTVRDESVM